MFGLGGSGKVTPIVKLRYEYTTDNLEQNKGNIRLYISNINTDTFKVSKLNGCRNLVNTIKAFDMKGKPLPVKNNGTISGMRNTKGNRWIVTTKGTKDFYIEYVKNFKIVQTGLYENKYFGYQGDGFASFYGVYVFKGSSARIGSTMGKGK